MPDLHRCCRDFREGLHKSRAQAYRATGVGQSYIKQIEDGTRTPSVETLDKLIAGYALTPAQAQFLRELRMPSIALPPLEQMRHAVRNDATFLARLREHQHEAKPAAYIDPLWNVLAANDAFFRALPGVERSVSVLAWLFTPAAKQVLVEWDSEASQAIAIIKAILGRHRNTAQARELMRHLGPNLDVRRIWLDSIEISYGRGASTPIHLRDQDTGEPISYLYTTNVDDPRRSPYLFLISAVPKPYSGPADL
ncbi:helix-turn-helix domain-containing protein [Nocardia sp. NPDC052566]|uniref:MmyB family transcriptional regulator n=1 Tax=Nocardia sp. NPDC052566 TaxID=3364330 RepID=UPI0037C76C22